MTENIALAEGTQRLYEAITDPDGELLPIDRIEIEILDGGQIRWNVRQDGQLLHSLAGWPDDLPGLLTATKTLIELRCGVS